MFKVLVYHKIEDIGNFEKQIVFLKKNYTLISCNDLINGKDLARRGDKPALLITVDDGDISFYNNAFPLLKKYDIPAVIFVITGLIGSKEAFWWDKIAYYLSEKEDANAAIWDVKKWPNQKRVEFIEKLKINSEKKEIRYTQLNYGQLREMQSFGIDIANHSHTHPLFDRCTPEELINEMESSIEILKTNGFSYDLFAYPNGSFSSESESILKNAGVRMAFIFDHKINYNLNNPLRISRLIVDDTTPLWKFRLILSGWHTKLLPISRKISNIKLKLLKEIN